MYNDDLLELPRDEEHFWAMIEDHFAHACHVLQDYEIETREEAIESASEPMRGIAYRNIPEEYDQREYCLEMGRDLIPAVEGLIRKRKVTLEFAQQWGKLMFCHGLIAGSVLDIGDDLATARGGRARAHVAYLRKRWLAEVFALPRFDGMKRAAKDYAVAEFLDLVRRRDDNATFVEWIDCFVDGAELRPTYQGKNFLNKDINTLLSDPWEADLPPIPTDFS